MSAAAPPPPPLGPPPSQLDLNSIYRPDEDPALQGALGGRACRGSEAFVFGDSPEPSDLLGMTAEPARQAGGLGRSAAHNSAMSLIDLDDSSGYAPSEQGFAAPEAPQAQAAGVGLLGELPATVSAQLVENPRGGVFLDLSAPAASSAQPAASSAAPTAAAASSSASRGGAPSASQSAAGNPVIPDAQGFGSDDLFNQGKDRNLAEELKGEAVAAWSSVVKNLPEEVKVQMPDCMNPPPEDPNLELNFEADSRQGPGPQGLPQQAVAPVSGLAEAGGMNQQHAAMAVNRACEGRWVPTYMRQQMMQNGHTAVPTAAIPNAHERPASAPPMPTVEQTLHEIGNDVQETAQTMVAFVVAFLHSVAMQMQMCSHQTATTVHDQVVTFGENLCNGVPVGEEAGEERVGMGPLPPESTAGYGPMRSRVQRTIQGVTFARLVGFMKAKFVGPGMPPEVQRLIRSRSLSQHSSDNDIGTEDMTFTTDVNMEAVPNPVLPHVRVGYGPLTCREVWHVRHFESSASVEISNAPSNASVTVIIRVDVTALPGGGCEVDSRLYAKPKEAHAPLPLGLVEQLTEVHHLHSESLRDVVIALAQQEAFEEAASHGALRAEPAQHPPAQPPAPAAPQAAGAAAESASASPTAASAPEAREAKAPSAPPAPAGPSALQVATKVRGGTELDTSLLMKMAEGI